MDIAPTLLEASSATARQASMEMASSVLVGSCLIVTHNNLLGDCQLLNQFVFLRDKTSYKYEACNISTRLTVSA
jgi:hypothetical protein